MKALVYHGSPEPRWEEKPRPSLHDPAEAIGVHGRGAMLHLDKLWDRNVTITTRLVDTVTTPTLLQAVAGRTLRPERLVTHRFGLSEIVKAYGVFANAAREGAMKVVLAAD